jgi:hypothetical protein
MKPLVHSFVLAAASMLAVPPALAGLVVQSLEVFVDARANLGSTSQSSGSIDDQGYALPFSLAATAELPGVQALALQDKGGFFRDRAAASFSWGAPGSIDASSSTGYMLTVRTDTPDTPLILDFHYYGTRLDANSYYAGGTVEATAWASISAGRVNGPSTFPFPLQLPEVWAVDDTIRLAPGTQSLFTQISHTVDTFGAGTPDAIFRNGWDGFRSIGALERGAFDGHIDFGVLQPGEWFVLSYLGFSAVEGRNVPYTGAAQAAISDPFGLSSGRSALRLAGLELPRAPGDENAVSEPATLALFSAGLAVVTVLSARRRRRPPRSLV